MAYPQAGKTAERKHDNKAGLQLIPTLEVFDVRRERRELGDFGWSLRQNKSYHYLRKLGFIKKNEFHVSNSFVKGVDNDMTEWNKGVGRESDAALQLARAYISEAPLPC